MALSCLTGNRCLACGGGCEGYETTREEMAAERARYSAAVWGDAARELYLSLCASVGEVKVTPMPGASVRVLDNGRLELCNWRIDGDVKLAELAEVICAWLLASAKEIGT